LHERGRGLWPGNPPTVPPMTFGTVWVHDGEQRVGHVLQVGKGLALPANQPAGIFGFDIEKDAVVEKMLLHGGLETEVF